MIFRTKDFDVVKQAMSQTEFALEDLELREWLRDDNNIALTNLSGDVSLFERQWRNPSIATGHYFFFSRGKEAFDVAKKMLDKIYDPEYNVTTVVGMTPLEHKGALWMNRKLGFVTIDTIETASGPCALVYRSRKDS